MGWIKRQVQSIEETKEMLAAYWRQGQREIGRALYGPDTVAQPPEYGMIGTKTPGEVADGMRKPSAKDRGRDQSAPNPTDEYIRQATERSAEPSREEPVLERE
jgi:hypothetical protein